MIYKFKTINTLISDIYLLNAYYEPSTIWGSEDIVVNTSDKSQTKILVFSELIRLYFSSLNVQLS